MSAAFNSTTARLASAVAATDTETECTGDPSTALRRLSTSKSFSRSALNGRSGFGSCSGRDLPWARPAQDETPRSSTPGRERRPSSPRMNAAAMQKRRPSGAFASTSDRFHTPRDETPGPGSYADSTRGNTSSVKVKRSSSFGSSRRFSETRAASSDSLGPSELRSSFAPPSHGPSASFASTTKREIHQPYTEGPDPGQHQTDALRSSMGGTTHRRASAAFADTSSRFKASVADGPDMGAYDAGNYNSMAAVSQRGTFAKSSARGAGGFGSRAARGPMCVDHDIVPGPGAYGAPLKPSNSDNRAGSSFASRSNRMNYLEQSDTPTPGTYNTNEDTLAQSVKKSHNKSSGSFGSKSQRKLSAPTKESMEKPGPGSYAQENHTFSRSTSGMQMSASFASGMVTRDSFLGL